MFWFEIPAPARIVNLQVYVALSLLVTLTANCWLKRTKVSVTLLHLIICPLSLHACTFVTCSLNVIWFDLTLDCDLLCRNDPGSSLVWISDRPCLCVVASCDVRRWQRCMPRLRQLGNGNVPAGVSLHMQGSFVLFLYTRHMPLPVSARSHNHKRRDDTGFHDLRYCYQFWTAANCHWWTRQTTVGNNVMLSLTRGCSFLYSV